MKIFLMLLHPLRSHHVVVKIFPDERTDQCSRYFVVELLLGLSEDVQEIIMRLDQKSYCFFVHVAVELFFDHILVQVEPLEGAR